MLRLAEDYNRTEFDIIMFQQMYPNVSLFAAPGTLKDSRQAVED